MPRRTIADIEKIWSGVEGVKKLSDRVVGIGPFGVGLDGLLTWIPGVGLAYSVGAGAYLLVQGMRAKASPPTLARMLAYLVLDSATTELFLVGDVVDFFFPGHLMAAKALQAEIERTHWVEASEREARASGEHARHVERMRADPKLKRVVYLHD
jgi:ABC-type hemin transport system ATPase subunit